MRIAFPVSSRIPSRAANAVQVCRMSEAFGQNGHDVTLYGVRGPADADPFVHYGLEETFKLHRVALVGGHRVASSRALALTVAAVFRDPRPDVVYARQSRFLIGCAPLGSALVCEAHTLESSVAKRSARRALFALPNFARLVTISQALADDYLEAFPELDASQVVVAHDGAVPAHDVTPRAAWPGRSGALQVGYVGGLYKGRGVEVLLGVARALPEIDLHVVGGHPEQVEAFRAEASPNVTFHGFVPHAEVASFYPHLDVLTAPYQQSVTVHGGGGDIRRWMSPLKVFEYMATGKAIVMTDVPVLREVLTHEETALLVADGQATTWIEAIRRLDEDRKLRASLGDAALALFSSEYTWTRRAERVVAGL